MKSPRVFGPTEWTWLLGSGLLLLLPLSFCRGFTEQFSYPKILLTKVLIVVGLFMWASGLTWGKVVAAWKSPLVLPILCWILVILLSCVNSSVPEFSLRQAEYSLCGPTFTLLVVTWVTGEAAVRRLATIAAIAGTIVAGIAVAQWMGRDPLAFGAGQIEWGTMLARMRLYSTFGNPNFVAGYLVGPIFLSLALGMTALRLSSRVTWSAAGLLMLVAIVGARSRGAWLGIIAGVMTAWLVWKFGRTSSSACAELVNRNEGNQSATRTSALSLAVPLYLSGLATVTLMQKLLAQIEGRLYLWRIGWSMFLEHPVIGSGWGTFQITFLDSQARFLAESPDMVRHWSNAGQLHNDPLQVLLETGFIGFAAFAWVLWTYGRSVRIVLDSVPGRSTRLWLSMSVGGATAILVDSFFNFQFAVPPTFLLLFTLFAFPPLISAGVVRAGNLRAVPSEIEPGWFSVEPGHSQQSKIVQGQIALRVVLSIMILFAAGFYLRVILLRAEAELNYTRALRLEDHEEYALAEDTYRRAVLFDPENDRLHFGLARALYLTDRLPEALREISLAERTYRDSHLEVLKARIQDQQGLRQQALESYRYALWLDPTLKTVQADIERLQK